MIDQRLKIAVFIDFDNIEIGVKTTLHTQFDIAAILEGIKERGEVVTKVAYGDWKRAGEYGRLLSQHAIRMVQRNLTPGGDKNGADINLALDALEMAFTHDHINAFVIVGGDSDFITLVEKLKQYDKKVFVVGGRQFTSQVMQKNCHEFIAYENLVGTRRPSRGGSEEGKRRRAAPADVAKVIPLVRRALKVLADREVSPQLGLLKSTLLQLDSTFSERDYGASTFRDFIEKIAKTGHHHAAALRTQHARRCGRCCRRVGDVASAALKRRLLTLPSLPPAPRAHAGCSGSAGDSTDHRTDSPGVPARAAQQARWPMYVRQIKQHLRSADPNFDEHKLGLCDDHGISPPLSARGTVPARAGSEGAGSRVPGSVLQPAAAMPASSTPEEGAESAGDRR